MIAERRNPSGEESDEDEDEGGEWAPHPRQSDSADMSADPFEDTAIVKSGYLFKKGERRKVRVLWLPAVLLRTKPTYLFIDVEEALVCLAGWSALIICKLV